MSHAGKIDVSFQGRHTTLVVAATGLKIGVRGKVQPAGEVLSRLTKGEARKVRKIARAAGRNAVAAARRLPAFAAAAVLGLSGLTLL